MFAHLYLKSDGKEKKHLCSVHLEVVPGGTYIVDGVPYKLADKPTFVIAGSDRKWGVAELQHVELLMEPLPKEA